MARAARKRSEPEREPRRFCAKRSHQSAVIGEGIAAGCEQWPVAPSPPSVGEPVTSDLPVLLLSGRFDPITPPDFAAAAAEHLAAATLVVRDGSSHGTWGFDGCINRIVDDFVADPGSPVDTSCAEELRPLGWMPIRWEGRLEP